MMNEHGSNSGRQVVNTEDHCESKKRRYMSKWETSLYATTCRTKSIPLGQLFGGGRRRTRNNINSPQKKSQPSCQKSRQQQQQVTFHMEHREGQLASNNDNEERILLFRSDRKGAVAKIIYTTCGESATSASAAATATEAKIQVLDVKRDHRGFDLGGLLFKEALLSLQHHHGNCHVVLDAEEDIRRHNKLVQFYQRLGCVVKANAKPQFLNNNDGETYRKVPMWVDVKPPTTSCQHDDDWSLTECARSFVPLILMGRGGQHGCWPANENAPPASSSSSSWLMVEDGTGHVVLQTTQGLYLTADDDDTNGHCVRGDERQLGNSCKFQLLRVSDTTQHVVSGDDEDDADQDNEEHELWILQSWKGSYLRLDPRTSHFELSPTPAFWQAHSDTRCLQMTNDTPARRQHYRCWYQSQTLAYVQAAKKHFTKFQLGRVGLRQGLDRLKQYPGFPFQVDSNSRRVSLRTISFRTAEAAREAGLPDWIQLCGLIHAMGSVVNSFTTPDQDGFDWTIPCQSRVLGCACPDNAIFAEFRYLNSDSDQYKSPLGMYKAQCGLTNVHLTWSGPEYLYNMLQHNDVGLPDEGLAVLRLFSLRDWHTRGLYQSLQNEDDMEAQGFVTDFDHCVLQARRACLEGQEMADTECQQLWESHYAAIAAKFGADGILEW